MKALFLGTSAAIPSARRSHVSFVLWAGRPLLVECGPTTPWQLIRAGVDHRALEDVLISHVHGDHSLGLPMFFMLGQLEGREWPLRVHCPESAVPQLKTICATCYPSEIELVERKVEWTGLPAAAIAPRELAGGVCLSTAPGIHPVPDVAFRFDFDGRSLVYSGDTAPAAAVRDLAQGAALLLHDATWSESIDGQTSPEHSSCRQAGRLAAEARVARLGLVHLNHRYLGREAELRAEAAELFDGEVLIPGDGAELEI